MEFLFTNEQRELKRQVRSLVEERIAPKAGVYDEMDDISWELVGDLAGAQLFNWLVPVEYGGRHTPVQAVPVCIIREELTRGSAQADVIFAMQGLGSYPITISGTEEQKRRYLPPVVSGQKLASFALTEPGAGSDVGSLKTTAIADGDSYVLNGMKKFTSNAPVAEIYAVFAKTDPSQGTKGISAFVVEMGTPGFECVRKLRLMAPHCIAEMAFKNCRMPRGNLLGKEGEGFKIAMMTLDLLRTSVGASAVGLAQAAFEEAIKYAKSRIQFGQPIAAFQAIQLRLADMATEIDAARLLVYRCAMLKDRGAPRVTKEASMAKMYATEVCGRVTDQALQIHGGNGVTKDYPIERLFREARANRIYEGTSDIQRLVIAGQLLKE